MPAYVDLCSTCFARLTAERHEAAQIAAASRPAYLFVGGGDAAVQALRSAQVAMVEVYEVSLVKRPLRRTLAPHRTQYGRGWLLGEVPWSWRQHASDDDPISGQRLTVLLDGTDYEINDRMVAVSAAVAGTFDIREPRGMLGTYGRDVANDLVHALLSSR